jgi:HK97 family phage portal protein
MLLDRLLAPLGDRGHRGRRAEDTTKTPAADADFWYGPVGGGTSAAGVTVNTTSALSTSPFWAAATMLARDVAAAPCHMYRRLPGGGKERAPDHPLYDLLRYQPNVWQSAFDYWQTVMGHLLLRGNHVSAIIPGPRGWADQLIPLHPDHLEIGCTFDPVVVQGVILKLPRFWYEWRPGGKSEKISFRQEDALHIRGFSLDGLTGVSVLTYARESIGLGLATEQYGARFFGQGSKPAGVLKTPNRLTDKAAEAMKKRWEAMHSGLSSAHRVAVLEEGVEWQQIGLTAEDSQFLQTREFGVREAARWTGVPAYRLQEAKTPTYASVYAYQVEYWEGPVRHWAVAIEQAIRRALIDADRTYFAEFLLESMLRGDPPSRSAFYHNAILDGWMTRNEVRERENLNRLPGLDEPLEPRNMAPAGTQGLPAQAQAILEEAAGRIVRKELAALRKIAQRYARGATGWEEAVRQFYAHHAGLVRQALRLSASAAEAYISGQLDQVLREGLAAAEAWPAIRPAQLLQLALEGAAYVDTGAREGVGDGPAAGDAAGMLVELGAGDVE